MDDPPAGGSWFVGLGIDDAIWDVTVFTKNRDRLLEGEIAAKFLRAVLEQPKVKALLSDDHFSVDGTLIQALRRLLAPSPPEIGLTASWRSMGVDEELPAQGRQRRAARPRPQRRTRLPPRAAPQ